MAVAIGTVTTASINFAGAATTISFTSTAQPLYVIVPHWRATRTLNTVTFNGVGLTRVAQSAPSNGDDAVEIWRLLTPSATTANVVLTFSGSNQTGSVGIFNTTGQDTGTPEGTAATATSTVAGTTTGNVAISGAASGDLTIVAVTDGGGAAITPASTGGSGMTEFMDLVSNGQDSEGFRVSDAVTVVSATFASNSWSIAAIPLKVSGGGGAATPSRLAILGVG